jgi:hypothetical protein
MDEDVAHEIYHEDAVLEFLQSGERFEGVENFRGRRRIYPVEVNFEMRRVREPREGGPAFGLVEGVLPQDSPWSEALGRGPDRLSMRRREPQGVRLPFQSRRPGSWGIP